MNSHRPNEQDSTPQDRLPRAFLAHVDQIYSRSKMICHLVMAAAGAFMLGAIASLVVLLVSVDHWQRASIALAVCMGCTLLFIGLYGKMEDCHASFLRIHYCAEQGNSKAILAAIGKLTCYGRLRHMLKDLHVITDIIKPSAAEQPGQPD